MFDELAVYILYRILYGDLHPNNPHEKKTLETKMVPASIAHEINSDLYPLVDSKRISFVPTMFIQIVLLKKKNVFSRSVLQVHK